MGETNAEILQRAYDRFKGLGTPDATLVGPGFVWDMTNMAGWPEQPFYEGREGMIRFLADWTAAWDDWRLDVDSLHEAGEQVVALLRQTGRSKTSGLAVEMSFAQVWTFRDGKYLRMEMYSDTEQALREAGAAS